MSISFLRKFLVLLSIFAPGCVSDPPEDPVAALSALPPLDVAPPAVSVGVTPCIGWSWSLDGTDHARCSNDGSVSFHGGTWTVAPSVEPGRTLLGATVVLSAPTGHAGDATVFDIALRSSASPQVQLAEQNVVVTGAQQTVTLSIPARVVAPGETFQIVVFSSTSSGGYPSSDTTIASVALLQAARVSRDAVHWIQQGPFTPSLNPVPGANQPVLRAVGAVPAVASFEIPYRDGDTIVGLGWFAYRGNAGGLGSIDVLYKSDVASTATPVQLAGVFDTTKSPKWDYVKIPISSQTLSGSGRLWVNLEIDATDYYISDLVTVFR